MGEICGGCFGGLALSTANHRQCQTPSTEIATQTGLHLRYYLFDWDDNVVCMPTRIWMEDASGRPVPLSTADFAKRRDEPGLRPLDGDWGEALREFRDETGFERDLARAREGALLSWQGPAWSNFKKAVIEGRLFAIITARGISEETMRRTVSRLLDSVLSDEERQTMLRSLHEFNSFAGCPFNEGDPMKSYLDLCSFIGVNSPDFRASHGDAPTEVQKQRAIRAFVSKTLQLADADFGRTGTPVASISFGMSDDDAKNVAAVEKLMRDELAPQYPHVKFRVFDTGGSMPRKIII